MSRLVTATVTEADLAAGQPGCHTDTHPVALAVRRALRLGDRRPPYIGVGESWFAIHVHGSFHESHDIEAPGPAGGAHSWLAAYDRREPAGPFTFSFRTAWGAS